MASIVAFTHSGLSDQGLWCHPRIGSWGVIRHGQAASRYRQCMLRSSVGRIQAIRRATTYGCLVCVTLVLVACANRPTTADLSESIVRAAENDAGIDVTPEQASCIADQLLASDLSDTTMSGLASDFDNPEVLAAEVNRVEPAVATAAAECIE